MKARYLPARWTLLALLVCSSLIACRSKRDTQESPKVEASSVATPTAASATPTTAEMPIANRDPAALGGEDTPPAMDAGTTADRKRHHRSASAATSAAPVASAEPPPPPPAPAAPAPAANDLQKHTPPKPMGNDAVYGGSSGVAPGPMLKKTPLEDKDPWAKPNP